MVKLIDISRVPLFGEKNNLKDESIGCAYFHSLADAFEAAVGLIEAGVVRRDNVVLKNGSSVFFVFCQAAEMKATTAARERGGDFVTITLQNEMFIEQWYHSNLETGELGENHRVTGASPLSSGFR